ncbi:MAG: 50S ribosomal protein L4 [Ilumatobacteraceae bacterium]
MTTLTIKDATGKDAGTVELDAAVFAAKINVPLMHQVVTAQLAARRAGTQSTKTRSDVRGGGAKPYRQKGTGNARQGSIRSPQFTGGGVAHGPKPRKYDQKTPKKMIKAALRSALSDRAAEDRILVVDGWGIDSPKTKDARRALSALDISGTVLVVLGADDEAAALSFRNLPDVQVLAAPELNAYDVLCNDWIVFTADTLPTDTVAEQPAPEAKAPATKEPAKAAAETEESPADEADPAEAQAETEGPAAEGSASDEAGSEADQAEAAEADGEAEPTEEES